MTTKTKKAPKQVDPEPFMVGLNEDQRAAFAQMTAFIFTPDSSMFCLIGPAGTGKTFLITRFIQFLHQMERREIRTQSPQRNTFLPPDIAMTAPTNKAVQVLRDSSDKSLHGKVSFDTIHSLLGLKEQINDSGEVEFRNDFNDNIRIKDKTVIVIDEVSMLHDELFYPVKNYAAAKKIIFLGDASQIPPVGKEDSEPFLRPLEHNIITHRLTQIMRQREGSKIIELSMQIRESDNLSFNGFDEGDVSVMSANEERARLDANLSVIIRSKEFVANPGLMRIISWRNVKVAAYNKYVRTKLFEYAYPGVDISQRIQLCDRMITSEPYAVKLPSGDTEIRLTTNQEFTIQSILIEEQEVEHAKGSCELKFYNCIVRVFDFELQQEVEKQVSILHESSVTEFEYQSQKLKDAAMNAPGHKRGFFWREYYQFRRTYCRCDYAYAVTCHKSQGSTYDIAIVDSNDILLNRNMKEARRILYTAVTRAKNKLILIN